MTTSDISLIVFSIMLLANIVAFVRHWRMMRVLQIVLNNLITTQKQFNEIVQAEQRKQP